MTSKEKSWSSRVRYGPNAELASGRVGGRHRPERDPRSGARSLKMPVGEQFPFVPNVRKGPLADSCAAAKTPRQEACQHGADQLTPAVVNAARAPGDWALFAIAAA